MGSKGSQTTQTSQNSNSQYIPAGADYMLGGLNRATALANQGTPTIPTAPVAGFSQDQQNAFQNVNAAQGMAQPYINQARQDFSPDGAQQFLNPYASNVMAQMQNVFGQQQQQNNANLVQSAGGVGADRIAVGQGNLANQQGLAAGQTLSGLYNNAVQQAQSAGYGTAALGSQAQNAALQGAQAQLGTGGLQQQLSQAQLNAPYQQQLAQQALPYQLSQWYSGQVGALAPALGGSTYGAGTGTQTSQYNPSVFSQIAGLGLLGGGILGKGSGGAVPYARGGNVNPFAFDEGGAAPIDVSSGLFGGKKLFRLPDTSLPLAQTHVPSLTGMNQQQQPNMQQQGMQGLQGMQALGKSMGRGYNNSTSNLFGMSNAGQDALQDAGFLASGGPANPYALPHFDDGGGTGDGGEGGSVGSGSGGIGSDAAASASVGDSGNGSGSSAASDPGGSFGADDDAAAAGLAGAQAGIASGLGGLSDTDSIGAGFAPSSMTSDGMGFGVAGIGTPSAGIGDNEGIAGFGPGSINGPTGDTGVGFGFADPGSFAVSPDATEENTAPPAVTGLPGYGPPASPSLAATLGFSQPSLSPMAQNAAEAAQAAQAMAQSIPGTSSHAESMPSQQAPPGTVSAAVAAALGLPGQVANAIGQGVNSATGAAMSAVGNLPGPAAATEAATAPGVAPATSPGMSAAIGALSAPGAAPGMASPYGGGGGEVARQILALSQPAGLPSGSGYGVIPVGYNPRPGVTGGYDKGGSVNPYGYDDGGDVDPGDVSPDEPPLGSVGLAYKRLADMGLQRGQIDQAVQKAGPAAAAIEGRLNAGRLPQAIAGLESSGRGANGPQGRFANGLYQQYPAFAKQYGAGEDGVMNYARQVLKANPKATFGDLYGGYVTGTGNPAAASLQSLQTTTQPGAQGAYQNLVKNSKIDPSTPLASLMGGDAQGAPDATALGYTDDAAKSANPYAAPAANPALGYAAAATQPAQPSPSGGGLFGKQGYISNLLHDPSRMALISAGLGAFTPQGIAGGLQQGMQFVQHQQSVDMQAKKLEQEANFHNDQYTRSTPYQQFEMKKPIPIGQHIDPTTGQTLTTYGLMQPDGSLKPIDPTAAPANPAQAKEDDAALPANSKAVQGFLVPGKNVPDNVDPSVLANLDPGVANMVRSVDEGRMSLSQVPMKNRFMVERLLHAYDGQWDGTVWGARSRQQNDLATNGTAGKMITSVNQLLPHLSTLSDRAAALNATNYPEANTVKNWLATATGDPRVKRFNSVRDVAATDAARLLRGTGAMTESEIDHWRQNFAAAGSPSQLQDVIRDLADDLIGARMSSIRESYRINMRQEPPEFLSPEAKGALTKIKGGAAPAQPAAAAPAAGAAAPAGGGQAAAALPPKALAKLQEGHITTFGNGQKWTLRNGQPAQVP
jgi:hypothetical protein